jgi:hypothetical protein
MQNRWMPLTVSGLCLFVLFLDTHVYRHLDVPANSVRFASGAISIDGAYTRPATWAFHLPWGAIYPGARGAYAIVGPHTPIWTLHVHSYCMLPDCNMEAFMSFNMTQRWDRIMFGPAEEARHLLQSAGINYFLFTNEIAISDPVPLGDLFSPDHIAENLALRWTDGTTSLLTWPGVDTRPLDNAWVTKYRKSVEELHAAFRGPYMTALRDAYERYYTMPHPWKPIPLP